MPFLNGFMWGAQFVFICSLLKKQGGYCVHLVLPICSWGIFDIQKKKLEIESSYDSCVLLVPAAVGACLIICTCLTPDGRMLPYKRDHFWLWLGGMIQRHREQSLGFASRAAINQWQANQNRPTYKVDEAKQTTSNYQEDVIGKKYLWKLWLPRVDPLRQAVLVSKQEEPCLVCQWVLFRKVWVTASFVIAKTFVRTAKHALMLKLQGCKKQWLRRKNEDSPSMSIWFASSVTFPHK